ncbi:MAG: holo-[acyl-carrier-protein] synthase [Gemmataceae bacterium]
MFEIFGIGTDIVECVRIGRLIERYGELFLRRVYTEREILYCQGRRRATEHFAARWAAKEAVVKAFGTGWRRGMNWTDIEIRHDPQGRPQVLVRGTVKEFVQKQRIADVLLSMSHCRTYATALAIALMRSS